YYPQGAIGDATNSDATYQNPYYPDFGYAAFPGGPGYTFTVGTFMDINATNGYIPDTYTNQGRTYAFGADGLSTNGYAFYLLAGQAAPGYADGFGTNALFDNPESTAVAKNFDIFVADSTNNRIREVTTVITNWLVTTVAGSNGVGHADGAY